MRKKFRRLFFLFFSFVFILTIFYFVMNFNMGLLRIVANDSNAVIEQIEQISINKIQGLQEYYHNTDVKGIVSIEGLHDFRYPIVQTSDNDYYLNHDYFKNYDVYGAIMADYRIDLDNSKKVLIFGHSSIKGNVPFNELENYYDEDYYNHHKYITLETETALYRYEIFSVYVETNDFTYMNINFDSNEDWYLHILGLQKKSLYSTDVVLNALDEILIMQTCSNNREYQNYSKKYLLIVSRRIE